MIERDTPWIIGHRGVAAEATENTLPSLQLAVAQDADMIEIDVQLTADGVLIVFHDWDLTRMAERPEVVEETSASRLAELLPDSSTLPEVLDALPETMPINIELKRRSAAPEALARAIAEAIGERSRILVSSFDWGALETVRQTLPELPLAPLSAESPKELLAAAEQLDAWSLHCNWRIASEELVSSSTRPVLAYTVNDVELATELFRRGVAGVFTDAPGQLRRALES